MARPKSDGGDGKPLSQMAMVRVSLQEMGGDPKPQEMQDFIKTKFNKEIPANIISNYKSQLKRKGLGVSAAAGTGRRGRKPGGGGILLEDLEVVRGLVSRLGADQVRRLVDVLA